MAYLPKAFSITSSAISAAIAEGRAEEAMHKLVAALRVGQDDPALRNLAADWIERIGLPAGAAKALRKGQNALLEDWVDISEMVETLQSIKSYAEAVAETAKHFGCSERHVQKCVAEWRRLRSESHE